ncbi:MAG: hypothetical protein IJT36_04780 [Alphaproteobacteria bacterium]|nr:hypothetical protein [Alphaproteobacteria bacterium]
MKKSYLYAAAYAVTFLFFEVDNSADEMEIAEDSAIYETVVDRQTFMSAVNSVCDMIDIVKDAVAQADEKLSAQYA